MPDSFPEFLKYPFVWGLALGLLFYVFSMVNHLKTKRDYTRFQKHLSDKLELEAKGFENVRVDKENLLKETENLRLKIAQLTERPENRIQRDIEIMVRAEKRMMINAPGFAAAWENAKAEAIRELEDEERGKSVPKRLFTRLFGGREVFEDDSPQMLTDPDSVTGRRDSEEGK